MCQAVGILVVIVARQPRVALKTYAPRLIRQLGQKQPPIPAEWRHFREWTLSRDLA
jgi:hypothetical protein